MNRWLVSTACTLSLAVPAFARAQVARDTTIKADTTITQTQTTAETRIQSQTDTLYRSTGRDFGPTTSTSGVVTDTTVRTTPAPTYGGSVTTTTPTDTARYTGQTYGTTTDTYAVKQEQDDDDHHQKGGFEIKGGLSWGNVSNRGVLPGSLNGRNGFALGLGMFGGSPVGFGIEGLYVQRGVENDIFDVNSRRLDYIDIPGYLRISIPFALQPFVYAGPQLSFEVRCRTGSTVGNASCPDTGRPSTSWSGIIGAGIRVNPGVALSFEGRYVYGLTDLNLSTVTSASSYRTRSFMLLAGIGL